MLLSPHHVQGMSVVRLNMSHGDHKSHKAVVDLVREYNRLDRGNLAIMLDTKGPEVRSGDLSEPIDMKAGGCPPRQSALHSCAWPARGSLDCHVGCYWARDEGGWVPPRDRSTRPHQTHMPGWPEALPTFTGKGYRARDTCWRPVSAHQDGGRCASWGVTSAAAWQQLHLALLQPPAADSGGGLLSSWGLSLKEKRPFGQCIAQGVMPQMLHAGDKFIFTIEEGANGHNGRISVNYDGFIEDVSVDDILLVDGGLQSLKITSKDGKDVHTEVVDGGTMKSRQGHPVNPALLCILHTVGPVQDH